MCHYTVDLILRFLTGDGTDKKAYRWAGREEQRSTRSQQGFRQVGCHYIRDPGTESCGAGTPQEREQSNLCRTGGDQ